MKTTMVEEPQSDGSIAQDGGLASGFLQSFETIPDRTAVEVGGQALSYRELRSRSSALASLVRQRTPEGGPPLTAVFAHRSATTFAGILGALVAGHGYVPLNRTFPVARTRWMFRNAGCRSLIVDSASEDQVDRVLDGIPWPVLVLAPERRDITALAARCPGHTVIGADDIVAPESWTPAPVSPDAMAYLLFTSGSTGHPKGVMVSHRNAAHFVNMMTARWGITADDRFSQMFDTTFDLSVLDLFIAWQSGACVCCPDSKVLLNPDKFIRENRLSVWAAVPSVGVLMKRFGVLKPRRYPSLRWVLFCGEPLPADVADAWAVAAPQAALENLYGPTELTVACSAYRWDPERSPDACELGVVPIGLPFPGMQALVVDDDLREVPPGEVGELLMTGPQVTSGYWENPEATRRAYVVPAGKTSLFYRTGDRVRRPTGDGPFTYIGRVDHQVKILGYRIELGEVESKLRAAAGVEEAVALGWPLTATGPAGISAFVTGRNLDVAEIRSSLEADLPAYAVPHAIHVLPEIPQTANGKIDRAALLKLLQV
jgi:amino acid adenylation domain-containing protein